MKPQELRVGNKLQKDSGEVFTVLRLDNTNDVLVEEQRGLLTLGYNLFGIPLTKEWLIRFGFVKMGNDHEFGMNKYFVCKRFGKYEMCQGIEYNSFTKPFEFVHQLQNLYLALTGEELKLKEQ